MGDECPLGVLAFQSTLWPRLNSEGSPRSGEMPDPFGPRKRGQSDAATSAGIARNNARRCLDILKLDAGTGKRSSRPEQGLRPKPGFPPPQPQLQQDDLPDLRFIAAQR